MSMAMAAASKSDGREPRPPHTTKESHEHLHDSKEKKGGF
jgi:hypothetical protein